MLDARQIAIGDFCVSAATKQTSIFFPNGIRMKFGVAKFRQAVRKGTFGVDAIGTRSRVIWRAGQERRAK
jgi:hypothetical protein